MRPKTVIAGIILCAIVAGSIYLSIPSPIISNVDKIQIHRVSVVNSKYESEDITPRIDSKELAQTISSYNRSKLPHSFAPYQMTAGDIEIDYTYDNKLVHILLGNVDVVYESADRGGFTINNSEQLVKDVQQMIQ